MEKPFLLSEKTLMERKLAAMTVLCGNMFILLIFLFFAAILTADFRSNRALEFTTNPAMYSYFQDYAVYFLFGIPVSAIVFGVILLFYRSVRIGTLCLYHFTFGLSTLIFVLLSCLILILAHGNNTYSVFTHVCQ